MNELQIFDNPEFGKIRGLMLDGDPWFVGKDVATALGYSNPRDALARHVDSEDKNTVAFHDGIQGNPNMTIINESGLYSLILSSKLPTAKRFKHWVTSEVLPAIRKTGRYEMEVPAAPARYAPTRPLTTDDYEDAARTIAKCHNSRLPLVLDLLKKAGYDLAPIERAKQEAPPTWRDEREARRAHMVALLNQFSLPELCRRLGLSKSTVQYYRTGEFVPRMDRYRAIVHILEG